jgi:hypothetical protein
LIVAGVPPEGKKTARIRDSGNAAPGSPLAVGAAYLGVHFPCRQTLSELTQTPHLPSITPLSWIRLMYFAILGRQIGYRYPEGAFMFDRRITAAALAALLSLGSRALADAPPAVSDFAAPYTLMESGARQVGLATKLIDPSDSFYRSTGIEFFGHVEMGYTYNFDNPATRQNAFRVFDFEDGRGVFNQVNLTVERKVDYHKDQFDIGGRIDLMYGGDARFIHANGIFDYQSGRDQFDPVQFYGDIALPWLGGIRLRMGKFVNLVGYESIDPTADFIGFYSRSFVFGSGYPFTHFGALATFDPCKSVTVTAGVTRGDEQGFKDMNDAVSFLGSVNWVINKQLALYVSNSTGPEQPGDNSDYRTTWDATLYYQPMDKLKLAGNAYYLYDNAGAPSGGSGILYAFAALGSYELCKEATVKGRIEWFHDHDGLRTPEGTDLYEITLGFDVVPFASHPIGKNFMVRPEVRYDFSDSKAFNDEKHQFTAAIDMIFKF